MKLPTANATPAADIAEACRATHSWTSAYLSARPLSDPRRIAEWQAWATAKLKSGWDATAVRQHIADAWAEHASRFALEATPALEPDSPIAHALADCHRRAGLGATPAQTAVVYRSLAREHPNHAPWLARFAAIFADMGDRWNMASAYLAAGW